MANLKVELAVGKILRSGFRHHAYEDEKELLRRVLNRNSSLEIAKVNIWASYGDFLNSSSLRSFKTGLVCVLTVLCRAAIEYGADSEYSFAMSDYYLWEIERSQTKEAVEALFEEIVRNYQELVDDGVCHGYSPPNAKAVRYIRRHLYGCFTVAELAEEAGFCGPYFSKSFKKEVGVPPQAYMEACRLEEARRVLAQGRVSVVEIAEALGFCSASYFARRYKLRFGVSPSMDGRG